MQNITDGGFCDIVTPGKIDLPMFSRGVKLTEFINLRPGQFSHVMILAVIGVPGAPTPSALFHHIGCVVLCGAKEKMIRPDAGRIVAMVKYPRPIWDGAVMQFIGQPMNIMTLALEHKDTVSRRVDWPNPQPAILSLLDTRPEILLGGAHLPVMTQKKSCARTNGTTTTTKTSIAHKAPPISELDIVYKTNGKMSSWSDLPCHT